MTLNRAVAPKYKTQKKINLIKATHQNLSNGIPVYVVSGGDQEVIRANFTFNAGSIFGQNPITATAVTDLVNAGTKALTAAEIAQKLEFFGTYSDQNTGNHTATFTLYCLGKYFQQSIEIVSQLLFQASFPEHEFEVYKTSEYQQFKVNSSKPSQIARENFFSTIFGHNHPYGKKVVAQDYKTLTTKELKNFHANYFKPSNLEILLAGKVEKIHLKELENSFGKWDTSEKSSFPTVDFSVKPATQKILFIPKENAVQNAIRVGKVLFNKKHPDYTKLKVTNTALGGYFGSHLMTNIREDKGYTYGIGSGIVSMLEGGFFGISTEVRADVANKTIDEIRKELKILRTEPIKKQELDRIKSYLIGSLMQNVDGAFAMSDIFTSLHNYNLGYDFFDKYVKDIQEISSEEILQMAQKYLHEDEMYYVSSGKA